MPSLSIEQVRLAVQAALAEDVGIGDVTTLSIVPPELGACADIVAREPMVACGLAFVEAAFNLLSPDVEVQRLVQDGQGLEATEVLARITGPAQAILTGERVALNFLQRLSGVATLTSQFVAMIDGTSAKILDTRKTTPGWRQFEKYAVACGGGQNHRFGLFDQVLIKDNHLAALRHAEPNPIAAAVTLARTRYPNLKIEVETDNLEQVAQAADAGADIILLDNMSTEQLRAAVQIVNRRAMTEASGGVSLLTVRTIADTGVDFISVGALTHSARSVDIGMDFQ